MVESVLPDGTVKEHPFIIISCSAANRKEDYYTGVMISATKHTDQFSMELEHSMFEAKLDKDDCQVRLYIVVSFRESNVRKWKNRMIKGHFKALMEELKGYVFSIDP